MSQHNEVNNEKRNFRIKWRLVASIPFILSILVYYQQINYINKYFSSDRLTRYEMLQPKFNNICEKPETPFSKALCLGEYTEGYGGFITPSLIELQLFGLNKTNWEIFVALCFFVSLILNIGLSLDSKDTPNSSSDIQDLAA